MIFLNKEDKIIHTSLVETRLMDERLSPYATKNSECIKVKHTHKPLIEFDIRWPFEKDIDRVLYSKSYSRYVDKTQALSFLVMFILQNVLYMFNGYQELQDKLDED